VERVLENLAQSSVLAKLSEHEMSSLSQWAVQRHFEKGEYVAHYGEVWPYLAVINSGVIKVVKFSPDGRCLGSLSLQPKDEFWSPSLFDGGPLPGALEVRKASSIFLWHRDHILPIVQKNNRALWELNLLLMQRIRRASSFIEELTFYSVSGRLARLLLSQFEDTDSDLITRNLSLDEMGAMIGTTPVMVCKQLYRFAEEELIKVSRTEFQLINHEGLAEIAGTR